MPLFKLNNLEKRLNWSLIKKFVISKAQAQADLIVNDAIEKARHLSFQTEDMKRQSKIFRSRFRMLVEAQLDLLKMMIGIIY